ncbi:unnamed protein product [Triticum turgidum subsp. durum]|uniref:F-box domain-containing protein n=1 Tax=Triticum turgidum subsp. durum TaxID=4567 RepID=A0A9R1RPV3_TRITD|nr:unnamed protein product [Triticum turgidum subsp. durum]
MPPPPATLPDELLEEILLRLPPDDPGCLFRASLVCKPWRSRLTGPAFTRLYREFHGAPPLLGFFENDETVLCWFSPLPPTSPFFPVHPGKCSLFVLDSRHGLVLSNTIGPDGEPLCLIVWDPVGHRQWRLPLPDFVDWPTVPDCAAAVLCAADGCDHLDCPGDPFRVVYVGTDDDGVAQACVYSSESRAWSPVTSCEHPDLPLHVISSRPNALVGDAVYFLCHQETFILQYDLLNQELSMIYWPPLPKCKCDEYIVMATEDGELGCATLKESKLELWSMEADAGGAVKWVTRRVVDLQNLLPSPPRFLVCCANGVHVFFARTDLGTFTVELNSGRVKKVSSSSEVIPYMRFYTPAPSTMASSSENIETAQDEHHDQLLPHSTGDVGDEKEKWVEKGEEDCEWEDGWEEEAEEEKWEWEGKKALKELFDKGSKAIEEEQFVHAKHCFHDVLESRTLYYGRLSPLCISTYYKYGLTLLYKARADIAPYQDLVKGDDTGISMASGSNVKEGDTGKDLDLAWKMFHIARAISENCPWMPMVKVDIYCALAEVSMEREDIDYSLRARFKALAILEHLVEPDHCRIVLLNFHIFLAFTSASKIRDALPYVIKVVSLYKSRVRKLRKALEDLLAVKGENAPAAEVGSEELSLDNEIDVLNNILTALENKLEDLTQATITPVSVASGMYNIVYAVPRAASPTLQIAGGSNSVSTAATVETQSSTGIELETAGQGMKQANAKLISAEPS